MSPEVTFVCYLVALIAFGLAAVSAVVHPRLSLVALGLGAWLLPTFWASLEAL